MAAGTLLLAGAALLALALAVRALRARLSTLPKEELVKLVAAGALVLDVRTPQEFAQGHAPGSRNIPLDRLGERLGSLDRHRPIVVCCASGARSTAAKGILEQAGFEGVHDAGSWRRLPRA